MGLQTRISSLLSKESDWYSQGVAIGDFYFISSQTPYDKNHELISNDVREQALYILKKIQLLLLSKNLQLSDVMVMRIYFTNEKQKEGVSRAMQEVFAGVLPAVSEMIVLRAQDNSPLAIDALAIRTSQMQCKECKQHDPY